MFVQIKSAPISNPRTIYPSSDADLRAVLEQKPFQVVQDFIRQLFEKFNIRKSGEVNNLMMRLISAFPQPNDRANAIMSFCNELFFEVNRKGAERIFLEVHQGLYASEAGPIPINKIRYSIKQLCMMDVALTYRFSRVAKILWDEKLSLDEKSAWGKDLLSIVSQKGTLLDFENFLNHVLKQTGGVYALNAFLAKRGSDIAMLFLDKDIQILQDLLNIFKKYNVNVSLLAKDMMKGCKNPHQLEMLERYVVKNDVAISEDPMDIT